MRHVAADEQRSLSSERQGGRVSHASARASHDADPFGEPAGHLLRPLEGDRSGLPLGICDTDSGGELWRLGEIPVDDLAGGAGGW